MTQPEPASRVALVTGAARRIGAEIARTLHGAGYRVALHYHHSAEEAEDLAAQLDAARPGSVRTLQADLAQTSALAELVERAAACWDGLDLLVNNASAFYPTPLGQITEAHWDDLMASNLKAPLFLAQAAVPYLRRRGGNIINIVDVYAERPLREYPVYSVAKAGLAALTKALAVELAPEIRVNGVAPGSILWPAGGDIKPEVLARVALERPGTPADIAQTVLFLADSAPYVTGQILAVDGGRSLFI
jgi:pteridine reductase